MNAPPIYLSCLGAFHHFDLARQLAARGLLRRIFSSFPRPRLARERIDPALVVSIPWLYTPFMLFDRLPLADRCQAAKRGLRRLAVELHDRTVAASLHSPGVLVGLSGHNFHAGRRMQALGGRWICDRGSSHASHQAGILAAEYRRVGLEVPQRLFAHVWRELREYAACDLITVPTHFARNTFLAQGVAAERIAVVPYGVDLSRFHPVDEPPRDELRLLFVGGVGVRKGVHDLLTAFAQLPVAPRGLDIAGPIEAGFDRVLARHDLSHVTLHGPLPQTALKSLYSRAHFLVLPSVEEGLAMVQGQALACGCPVVSTPNAGAADLFEDGAEGCIVPIHRPDLIADRIAAAWYDGTCWEMRRRALQRVRALGGWDDYGRRFVELVTRLAG